MTKKLLVLAMVILPPVCNSAVAQENDYMMEIGLGGGGSFYMGDANTRLYNNTNGVFSVLARYNVNPRFSLKADLAAAGISGSTDNAYGVLPGDRLEFSRTLYDLGVQMEWGFCGYGMEGFNGNHRLAPYGLLGIGMTFAPKPLQNDFAADFPVGMGIRYKLSERVNLGLEWTMRFSTSDRLDVTRDYSPMLEDPFMIKGKGIKNKDSYSFTMLYVTFDVFKRPCHCDDEK
ncbi:MAG: outer membrane beta-barrel protein [Bacteroidaceae bacterium]|nr:outer membrane beta-barrel protein [Bacteroidaceae bacterium]